MTSRCPSTAAVQVELMEVLLLMGCMKRMVLVTKRKSLDYFRELEPAIRYMRKVFFCIVLDGEMNQYGKCATNLKTSLLIPILTMDSKGLGE